ncbi:aminotransferase-like domain-containing protein [Pinisolibacter sp.]|uniref:aminotransferase-like domain-containing protein n=1 Tax=Pinisolibacter sp. TaxID=2172024 RepID=UPI002FDDF35B
MDIRIERDRHATLVGAVVAAVERAIDERRSPPGARLPSIRRAAEDLGLSKSTVVEAYDRLVAAGRVVARPGSGFTVAPVPRPIVAEPAPPADRDIDPSWVMRRSLELDDTVFKPGCGWLPSEWLEEAGIRRALRALARDPVARLVDYGSPLGHAGLRQVLARRLGERGIAAEPGRIVLTAGASAAVDLVVRLLVEPGDTVFVDDPCYYNFRAKLKLERARVIGIPFHPDGPDLEVFEREAEIHRPRLYLTNAGPHNPTGGRIGAATAHRLVNLAGRHGFTIVEDDVFADFETRPAPRMAALDGLERVIHVGSFSKTLSSAIRLGWIATDRTRAEAFTEAKLATSFTNDDLAAQVVHRLLVDGSYRRHVDGLRRRLGEARVRVCRALERLGLRPWGAGEEGIFVWAELPEGVEAVEVSKRADAAGVVLAPGNVFSPSLSAGRFLRFNVAQCGHRRIFEVLAEAMAGRP